MKPMRVILLMLASFAGSAAIARADGGIVRLVERQGGLTLSVFTSPHPLTTGTADVSVLVQDVERGTVLDQAEVIVRFTPRDEGLSPVEAQATRAQARNKLFRAALVEIVSPGAYDVQVICRTPRGEADVAFTADVAARSSYSGVWPWVTWPFGVVLLYAIHRRLVVRRVPTPRLRNVETCDGIDPWHL